MTLGEFKIWFTGFAEATDGPPNAEQWERLKAEIAEIRVRSVQDDLSLALKQTSGFVPDKTFLELCGDPKSFDLDDGAGGMTKRAVDALKS